MTPEEVGALARVALDNLTELTTEDFSKGGDRTARKALATILALVGELDDETRREYALWNV